MASSCIPVSASYPDFSLASSRKPFTTATRRAKSSLLTRSSAGRNRSGYLPSISRSLAVVDSSSSSYLAHCDPHPLSSSKSSPSSSASRVHPPALPARSLFASLAAAAVFTASSSTRTTRDFLHSVACAITSSMGAISARWSRSCAKTRSSSAVLLPPSFNPYPRHSGFSPFSTVSADR